MFPHKQMTCLEEPNANHSPVLLIATAEMGDEARETVNV